MKGKDLFKLQSADLTIYVMISSLAMGDVVRRVVSEHQLTLVLIPFSIVRALSDIPCSQALLLK